MENLVKNIQTAAVETKRVAIPTGNPTLEAIRPDQYKENKVSLQVNQVFSKEGSSSGLSLLGLSSQAVDYKSTRVAFISLPNEINNADGESIPTDSEEAMEMLSTALSKGKVVRLLTTDIDRFIQVCDDNGRGLSYSIEQGLQTKEDIMNNPRNILMNSEGEPIADENGEQVYRFNFYVADKNAKDLDEVTFAK